MIIISFCKSDEKPLPGVIEIIHSSPFDDLTAKISEAYLSEDHVDGDIPFGAMLDTSLEANRSSQQR